MADVATSEYRLSKEATLRELYEELDTDREYRYDKRLFTRLMGERFPGLRTAHPGR